MLRHSVYMLVILALCTVLPLKAAAATNLVTVKTQPVSLTFDGQTLSLPEGQYSLLYQDRTYIPLRFISYALQKSVKWDQKSTQVMISTPTTAEKEVLKRELTAAAQREPVYEPSKPISVKLSDATLLFDGVEKPLPAGQIMFLYNNTIYVPLRFLSESAGVDLKWDKTMYSITGETDAYKAVLAAQAIEAAKPAYLTITSRAEKKLASLETACKATVRMKTLPPDWGKDHESEPQYYFVTLESCEKELNQILAETAAELTKYGYSTDIIEQYRAHYEAEMQAAREEAEQLMKE